MLLCRLEAFFVTTGCTPASGLKPATPSVARSPATFGLVFSLRRIRIRRRRCDSCLARTSLFDLRCGVVSLCISMLLALFDKGLEIDALILKLDRRRTLNFICCLQESPSATS